MASKLLDDLQSKFECLGCGKCCEYGGDMELTADEVGEIVICTDGFIMGDVASEFVPVKDKPGYFKLAHIKPCSFYSKAARQCFIYHHRPAACRRYPFQSLACGETTLAGVTICEGASRTVTKEFFNDKEV